MIYSASVTQGFMQNSTRLGVKTLVPWPDLLESPGKVSRGHMNFALNGESIEHGPVIKTMHPPRFFSYNHFWKAYP